MKSNWDEGEGLAVSRLSETAARGSVTMGQAQPWQKEKVIPCKERKFLLHVLKQIIAFALESY